MAVQNTPFGSMYFTQGPGERNDYIVAHRYLWQFDFVWNKRKLNDGERTILAIKASEGKWFVYRMSA